MAKSTNGGKSKSGSGETSITPADPKARRAPARRRTDKKTNEMPVAVASELAAPERTAQATTLTTAPGVSGPATINLSQDEISRRAFEIYCGRGCRHGADLEDWLEAERQLRQSRTH